MAIEGASAAPGRPPGWLQRATDIRFTGYSKIGEDTLVAVELPEIGEAAEELYRQRELWDTRPDPEETAFDVLGRVVDEVAACAGDSGLFDSQFLRRLARMRKVFGHEIQSFRIQTAAGSAEVNAKVARNAQELGHKTPPSRAIRVVGLLDMIRHSTRSFSLRLDEGDEIRGVMESAESPALLQTFFGKRVLALGRAVYRPSGRLLRIDAVALESGHGLPALFSKVPAAQTSRPSPVSRVRGPLTGKQGVAAFFGTWPGDETDTDLAAMLRDVRAGEGAAPS